MRYELTDFEWAAIRSFLPNKPRGIPRVDDRRVLTSKVHALVDANGLPVQLGLTGKARSQGAGAWRADTGRAGTDFASASP
jgi:transposase